MTRTAPARAERRRNFSEFFNAAYTQAGFTSAQQFADLIGVSRRAVASWRTGESYPRVHNLPAVADVLGVELSTLCDLLEIPIHTFVRDRFAADPDTSLPGLLRTWQLEAGLDNSQAAQLVGLSVSLWSKTCGGSYRPGHRSLQKIADATGIDVLLLARSGGTNEQLDPELARTRERLEAANGHLARLLRTFAQRRGLSAQLIAERAQVSASLVDGLLTGQVEQPQPLALVKIAKVLGVAAKTALRAGGYAEDADVLAKAATLATGRRRVPSAAEQLVTARRQAGVRNTHLARRMGLKHPAALIRYQSGKAVPTSATALRLAQHLPVDPALLVAASRDFSIS